MSNTHTRPARVRYWSPELATSVRHTYGFQPYCACGWEGKVWKSHQEAQLERSFHDCEARGAGGA